jgi:ankyrin repeat protein
MDNVEALYDAIFEGDADAVRRLLASDAGLVEAVNAWGSTPLMRAVSCPERSLDIINLLLDAGAQVNRQTHEGYAALHFAVDVDGDARLNTVAVLERLVAAGADLELRQHYGWTPLLRAIIEGTSLEVKTLLGAGANPNVALPAATLPAFNGGLTALMAALASSHAEEKVDALLRAGADPVRTDASGRTFFEYAKSLQAEAEGSVFRLKVQRCVDVAQKFDQVGNARKRL